MAISIKKYLMAKIYNKFAAPFIHNSMNSNKQKGLQFTLLQGHVGNLGQEGFCRVLAESYKIFNLLILPQQVLEPFFYNSI